MFTLGKRFASGLAIAVLGVGFAVTAVGPTRADNDEHSPYYLSLGVGAEHRENAADRSGAATKFKQGLDGTLALGRHVGRSVRVEAETNYFYNANDKEYAPVPGTPLVTGDPARGNIGLETYMFNVYDDITIKKSPRLKPFVGAGIGLFQSQVHGLTSATLVNLSALTGGAVPNFVLDTSSDWQTAYQFKAGLAYQADKDTVVYIDIRRFLGNRFQLQSTNPAITGGTGNLYVGGPRVTSIDVGVRILL